MEEGALLLADVDERRLDSGQHRLDPTQVDVADGAAMVRPVHQELDQTIVFEDGHAGFPLAPVDQDLAFQMLDLGRESGPSVTRTRPLRRLCPGLGGRSMPQEGASPNGPKYIRRKRYWAVRRGASASVADLPRISRAITIRWISLVPSPISHTLASRIIRSTGYSVV